MSNLVNLKRPHLALWTVFILLGIASILIGATDIIFFEHTQSNLWLILLSSRLPRLITLSLCGAGLAMSGVVLQHITHNRFAEPSTTGGMDAAKLGILVSLTMLQTESMTFKILFAICFCLIASFTFTIISQRIILNNTILVPIIGLMFGSVLSSIAEFYAYHNNMLQDMQNWLIGDFSKVVKGRYEAIFLLLPITIIMAFFTRHFTLLRLGKDLASSLGLRYKTITILGLILASCMVSISVVVAGSIPFVGLVIPNIITLKYGDNLSATLPLIALGGACFTIFCDILSRLIIYPLEIPIGLIAGVTGGLIFITLILKWKKTC